MKKIILEIPDNLFDKAMLILKKYFEFEQVNPLMFSVKNVNSIRKVSYSQTQEEALVKDYKIFLKEVASGKKITWYHIRKGKEYGLSKAQVLSILKKHGIFAPNLHRKNKNYEK